MSQTAIENRRRITGGSFLIEDLHPGDIFTREDISDVQRQIEHATMDFAEKQVQPQISSIEAKDFNVVKSLLRQAGDLGLMSIDVPKNSAASRWTRLHLPWSRKISRSAVVSL